MGVKPICQGEDGRMKAGCQPGLRSSICPGVKGESGLCVSTQGDGQLDRLCSHSCHIKHFNPWHCLSWTVSLSSSLLSFFPTFTLLPRLSRGLGVLLSCWLYLEGSLHLPSAPQGFLGSLGHGDDWLQFRSFFSISSAQNPGSEC